MDQVIEFFKGLFSTSEWPQRWRCGYWSDFHGWLYILSEITIWVAYFLIPLIIINYFYRKRTSIRFQRVYVLFASFILLCGSTHFIDALMFWVPMYRFNALVRLLTAIVSMATVYHLFRALPEMFKLKTNLELENEIARRTEAERQLQEANRGLEAFAYMASHDLQEPLRKIMLNAEALNNNQNLDTKGQQQLAKVRHAGTRMKQLITDVLSLTTLSPDVTRTKVDTRKVVQDAVESLEVRIQEKNATVQVGDLPPVMGHETYLQQVFQNLISNAIKFNENQPVVRIEGSQKDGRVFIRVSDNGIGLRKEAQRKIFDAFQRAHSKEVYEGTGIGLAIVKKIIDLHGGDIQVESEEGKGCVFTLNLMAAVD